MSRMPKSFAWLPAVITLLGAGDAIGPVVSNKVSSHDLWSWETTHLPSGHSKALLGPR